MRRLAACARLLDRQSPISTIDQSTALRWGRSVVHTPSMDQDLATVVGQRLRMLRQQRGVSLRELAASATVSASALSALENGKGGMSLGALQRVAAQIDLGLNDLLAPPPAANSGNGAEPEVEVFDMFRDGPAPIKRGEGVLWQLLGSGDGHALQPFALSFLPGGTRTHVDKVGHPGEEFVFTVLGEVEVILGEAVHLVQQGQAMRFPCGRPHAYRNASTTAVAFMVGAATPPW